jgi:hypothetical protein
MPLLTLLHLIFNIFSGGPQNLPPISQLPDHEIKTTGAEMVYVDHVANFSVEYPENLQAVMNPDFPPGYPREVEFISNPGAAGSAATLASPAAAGSVGTSSAAATIDSAKAVGSPTAASSSYTMQNPKFGISIEKTSFATADQAIAYDAKNVALAAKNYHQPLQIKIINHQIRDGIDFAITTYPYEIPDDQTGAAFSPKYLPTPVTEFVRSGLLYSITGQALQNNRPIPADYLDFVDSFHFLDK